MAKTRSKARKMLLTLLVIGVVGALAGIGTFSAFSDTTDNTGNTFAAGSVIITDNDSGAAMYNAADQGPGSVVQECITVTYQGSLAADVRLYTTSTVNAFAQYVDMTIEKDTGPGVFGDCTGFTADAGGPLFSGTLQAFTTTYDSYANGIAHFPVAQAQWNQNDEVTYRFTLTLQDNNAAQGGASGAHDFVWEAQNQ